MIGSKTLATLGLAAFMAGSAFAAVSPEEAARLGQELTPTGAERAGNADGSIPAWDPAQSQIPAGYEPFSGDFINPFADDKPLFTIDTGNWQDYADNLTEGTKAMFEKLGADGFRLVVYPTRRNYVPPDWLIENTKKNATGSQLVNDGLKISGNLPGVPFPIPQSGLEVMWNHMIRYQQDFSYEYDVYYVGSNGRPVLSTTGYNANTYPIFREENRNKVVGDTPWVYLRINYMAPARRAGEILLVHEPGADYTQGKGRKAWQYLVGQRRVRLAPAVSFDTPNPGVAGTSTYDDSYIYNGSPERFDWTLLGKKEIYVPYNAYEFNFQKKIQDMLGPKFLDPDSIRWEKHRVWVVEANLKEGSRHLYSKRRYYIDEDSWNALACENYDGRGNLWRLQYAYGTYLYDSKSFFSVPYGGYDVLQGIYNVNGKPLPGAFSFGVGDKSDKYFSPKGMARGGVR